MRAIGSQLKISVAIIPSICCSTLTYGSRIYKTKRVANYTLGGLINGEPARGIRYDKDIKSPTAIQITSSITHSNSIGSRNGRIKKATISPWNINSISNPLIRNSYSSLQSDLRTNTARKSGVKSSDGSIKKQMTVSRKLIFSK
jgi:hypothetical protein